MNGAVQPSLREPLDTRRAALLSLRRSRQVLGAAWLGAALVVALLPNVGRAADISAAAQARVDALTRLLEVDTAPGSASLKEAERRYREALGVAPSSPHLEYAYSLVLLKLFQPDEARAHLEKSLELDPDFVFARQALIRESIKGRRFSIAQEQLARFVQTLDRNATARPEHAEWVGRIVASTVLALGTGDAVETFSYQDRILRSSLSPKLLSAYERGFNDVETQLAELHDLIAEARSDAEVARDQTKAAVDARLIDEQNEIKLKQQNATKSRQKWDEWIVDQTAKADDLLTEQDKRFQDLDRAATTQLSVVTALQLQLDRVERNITPTQTAPSLVGFRVSPRQSLETALAIEQRKLEVIYSQQQAVSAAAAQTLAARRTAVAQYQQATGIVLSEAANLARWEKRNNTVAANMKKAAEKKPALVATLEARIRSLNTWDPVDFDSEKRRLLSDLGLKPVSQ